MTPTDFPQSNIAFGPPEGCDASQVQSMRGFTGVIYGGNLDGSTAVIVAWQPNPEEIQDIMDGKPVFLTCIGGLPPHFLTTSFNEALEPSE